MFHITPLTLSGLLITITYFPLFLFILLKGKSKITLLFALHIFSVFIWGICSLLIGSIDNHEISKTIWKIAISAVYFIPVFFLHSILLMTNKINRWLIFFAYLQAILFCLTAYFMPDFFELKHISNFFYYIKGNFLFKISFFMWAFNVSLAHSKLILFYIKQNKESILILLILSIIGFIGGTYNFAITFDLPYSPYGNYLVPIHSLTVTYAILKNQFLNIEFAIRKSTTYSLLIACISFIYLITVFMIEKFTQHTFGYNSTLISILLAFFIGLVFIPLRNGIQRVVDSFFFQSPVEEIIHQNELFKKEMIASEKYKTISTLTSGIAHEIKNPLTVINTFSEKLPERMDDQEFLTKFSKLISYEVTRINSMVHHLLDYTKPKLEFILSDCKVHQLIDDTLDFFNAQFIKYKIEVIKKYGADNDLTVRLDQNQIRQVLINLLINAIDAMSSGGQLTISTNIKSTPFSFTSKILEINIKDSGSGINPEDIPHIFEPFYTKKDKGNGLGLAISESIIKGHNGKISVKSELEKGTEFIVELPLS